MLDQVVATAPTASTHTTELVAAAVIFLTQLGQWFATHRKGQRRDKALGPELDRRFDPLNKGLATISGEVRDLKAHVIGPDGQNGLRGDMREIEKRVDGLETRERNRLAETHLHSVPDRRVS